MAARHAFASVMLDHLQEVEHVNGDAVARVADVIVSCWAKGGLLYAAGAGHSLAAVNEAFYRAGGLAFVRPIHDSRLLPLNGATGSTEAERQPGLADEVLTRYDLTPADTVVIFSNSGINYYPVELAQRARELGATVIAVTSVQASSAAPLRAGKRLYEISHDVLDTRVPPGDAAWPAPEPQTGPLSSLANAFLWNLVLAEVYAHATDHELDLPIWISANSGDASANVRTLAKFQARIPELG